MGNIEQGNFFEKGIDQNFLDVIIIYFNKKAKAFEDVPSIREGTNLYIDIEVLEKRVVF